MIMITVLCGGDFSVRRYHSGIIFPSTKSLAVG